MPSPAPQAAAGRASHRPSGQKVRPGSQCRQGCQPKARIRRQSRGLYSPRSHSTWTSTCRHGRGQEVHQTAQDGHPGERGLLGLFLNRPTCSWAAYNGKRHLRRGTSHYTNKQDSHPKRVAVFTLPCVRNLGWSWGSAPVPLQVALAFRRKIVPLFYLSTVNSVTVMDVMVVLLPVR